MTFHCPGLVSARPPCELMGWLAMQQHRPLGSPFGAGEMGRGFETGQREGRSWPVRGLDPVASTASLGPGRPPHGWSFHCYPRGMGQISPSPDVCPGCSSSHFCTAAPTGAEGPFRIGLPVFSKPRPERLLLMRQTQESATLGIIFPAAAASSLRWLRICCVVLGSRYWF